MILELHYNDGRVVIHEDVQKVAGIKGALLINKTGSWKEAEYLLDIVQPITEEKQ